VIRLYLLVIAVAGAVLYGSTYQQFRFFSLADPGGAADAIHYVNVANGHRTRDIEVRHYRVLTPAAAHLVQPLARMIVADDDLSIRLAFYIVNFTFSLAACIALFRVLQLLNYSPLLALLGMCAFASSRVTVLVTGTPLVDAAYFCSIAVVIWLTLERQLLALACVMPVLVLGKETVVPFLFLPLLTEMRRRRATWLGLAAAAIAFVIKLKIVQGYYAGENASYVAVVIEHARPLGQTALQLLTPAGFHDFQHGFSLLLPVSLIGAWLNARYRYHYIPVPVIATIPIAFGLALLSGNLGRMFFASFPAVIAYALIAVEHVTHQGGAAPLPDHKD
jgi:hypothetical protein